MKILKTLKRLEEFAQQEAEKEKLALQKREELLSRLDKSRKNNLKVFNLPN